ncbi:MAG TPA: hypothetical protein VJ793_18460 [Anaerolineae bacterium]|nr:hypothetical protein [Anaerolineae bacterium]
MNILDENIGESQRQLLKSWRIAVRQIGHEVGRKGMKDEHVIPFLLRLRRPTFFTLDFDFYRRDLCHSRYCLVCLDVGKSEAAEFTRRLLRHPHYDMAAKRMGCVIRVSSLGLSVWRVHAEKEEHLHWAD